MDKIRIIKKYPNRRLYDTNESAYITLNDLKRYVADFVPFRVEDAKTNEDLTRACLIQIILESEAKDSPLFSVEMLQHIIRYYGDPLQNNFRDFLIKSMQVFTEQKMNFQTAMKNLNKNEFVTNMTDLTQKNFELWQSLWGKENPIK